MKYSILLALLFATSTIVFAQNDEQTLRKFYGEIGSGPSTDNGAFFEVGVTALFKKNWTASLSYQNFEMNPKNLPSDYERGYLLVFPDVMPAVNMSSINLTMGKYFSLGRKTWITTEAGLAFVQGDKMTFTPQEVEFDGLYVSSNYAYSTESASGAGGIIKADFNWAIVPYLGLGVGAFANVNSVQSTVGLQFKLITGWLNTKKPKTP
jgi:hypothetical protein